MFGVPYIVIMVLAVQRIGTAVATVAVIFGQLAMSMLIDNFGWLGNPAIPFRRAVWARLSAWGLPCISSTRAAKSTAPATRLTSSG
jgi:transporter family-2 protein